MSAIKFESMSLGYPGNPVINAFTADIQEGEFVGVFGPNGAGKSTLLKALLGLVPVLSGRLSVFDKDPVNTRSEVGYLPQIRTNLNIGRLSGREVLHALYHGQHIGLPWVSRTAKQEISDAIQLVGANHYANRPFKLLSGGERQRLLLAQALFDKPRLLLLDEPLANLDPRYQDSLIELVKATQKRLKATVLFTAHDFNPLLNVMDRVLYITGAQAALGSVDEIIQSETLSTLYGAPMEVVRHRHRIFVFNQNNQLLDAHEHCHGCK